MTFEETYHEFQRAYRAFEDRILETQPDFDFEKLFCEDYYGSIEFTEVGNDIRMTPELLDFVLA